MLTKKLKFVLFGCLFVAGLTSMSASKIAGGTVRGSVTPPEGGLRAFLFSGKDTLSINVVSGAFQFSNVKVGNYKLLVEAAPPYRNFIKDGVNVVEGEFTDAGQIELQKQ